MTNAQGKNSHGRDPKTDRPASDLSRAEEVRFAPLTYWTPHSAHGQLREFWKGFPDGVFPAWQALWTDVSARIERTHVLLPDDA